MQHHRHTEREQADASLARFYRHLGHRMPATEAFRIDPRLSGRAVHEDLTATVERLRRASPDAVIARPLPVTRAIAVAPRVARCRVAAARERAFNIVCAATMIGITVWVGVPVATTFIMGAL